MNAGVPPGPPDPVSPSSPRSGAQRPPCTVSMALKSPGAGVGLSWAADTDTRPGSETRQWLPSPQVHFNASLSIDSP